MNVIEQIEQEQIERLAAEGGTPSFAPGDTVRVNVKVVEGTRERIQAFEGVCIARRNRGLNSAFTVRKLSYGEGVERVFPPCRCAHAGNRAWPAARRRGAPPRWSRCAAN